MKEQTVRAKSDIVNGALFTGSFHRHISKPDPLKIVPSGKAVILHCFFNWGCYLVTELSARP